MGYAGAALPQTWDDDKCYAKSSVYGKLYLESTGLRKRKEKTDYFLTIRDPKTFNMLMYVVNF